MAKRGLCILLTVLTVLSLAVPAFAAGSSDACGDNVTWSSGNGTLTISGTGAMYDYEVHYSLSGWPETDTPWGNGYTAIVIQDGVTSIGKNAFFNCLRCESVTIPSSVTSIGVDAFERCSSLTSVTIPEGVTSIGKGAFYDCSLTSVTIPDSVTSIGEYAFDVSSWRYNDLASITILNPQCTIAESLCGTDTTICGYDGSTAETFAKKYGYTFKSLGKAPSANTQLAAPTVKIAQTTGGIQVTWNKVAGASRYAVYYREGSGGWQKIGTTPDARTSYTWTKAQNGKTYAFTVRCTDANKVNISPYKASNSIKYAVQLAAPSVKIAQVSGGIQVTWNKVAGASRYAVYYREGSGGWQKIGTTPDARTSYTWTKAQNGKTYAFTVRCTDANKVNISPYKASNSIKYTVQLAAPSVKIAQVSGGVQVTWNKVAGASRYAVYYREGSGGWQKIGTTPDARTSYTWTKAQNGKTYAFTVRCTDANKVNISPYKASNSVKYTVELAAPTVTIAQVSGGIQVTWNAVSGSPRYMVYYKENGGKWQQIGTTSKTSYTHAAKKLKNGATYQFTVRCCASDKKTLLGPYKASNSVKYKK